MNKPYRALIAGLLLLMTPMLQAFAEQLTSAGDIADFPDIRIDSNGARHLVWYNDSVDNGAIFYKMFSSTGAVLIDATQINAGGSGNRNIRPSLNVDGSNRVFVVWQNMADQEIWMLRLEPYLDDRDGSAATLSTIKTLNDTRISSATDGDPAKHPRSAIDAAGNLHIVWESDIGAPLQYVKVDPDGVTLNGPVLLGGTGSNHDLPDVAIDSHGNVHIVFGSSGTTIADEVYYTMLDGATGAVRIDKTLLSADEGLRAKQATVSVNPSDNTVYVLYGQATSSSVTGGEEVFLTGLDPNRDDQDGSSASLANIRLYSEMVSDNDGVFSWYAFGRFGADRRIHALYIDYDNGVPGVSMNGCPGSNQYTVRHVHITTGGRILARDTLSNTGLSTTCNPLIRMAPGGNRIVWSDSRAGGQEIFSTTFNRVDAGSSGFTCSLRNSGHAAQAGDFWLLMLVAGGWLARRRVASATKSLSG